MNNQDPLPPKLAIETSVQGNAPVKGNVFRYIFLFVLFLLCLLGIVFIVAGIFQLQSAASTSSPTAPHPLVGLISLAIGIIFVAFWGSTMRKLWKEIQGEPVPHLLPKWFAIPLALIFGLYGIYSIVAILFGHSKGIPLRSGGASIVFLVYAFNEIRKLFASKNKGIETENNGLSQDDDLFCSEYQDKGSTSTESQVL
jgi:hypothetical protein